MHYIHILKEVIAARAGHNSAVFVPADACVINQSLYVYAYTCLTNLFQSLTGTDGTITTLKQAVNNISSCVEKKIQLDATEWFIALIICSTCFGHFYARHQELETICVLLPPMMCDALVAGCWRSGAGKPAMRSG